jgi:protein ImuB
MLIKLRKVGIRSIGHIVSQPRHSILPRFGKESLLRLDQALGREKEILTLIQPVEPYEERLPCLEPIRTNTGIEIALTRLLELLCHRLKNDTKGLRSAVLTGHRVDGALQQISIGTTRASYNIKHLFQLFAEKIPEMEPDLGFEIFVLEAPKVEDHSPLQESLWGGACTVDSPVVAELLDRLTNKAGVDIVHRYLPAQHHWPDRSTRLAKSLDEKPGIAWPQARPRPIHLLHRPEPIEVTAPIPDYPPMNFRYKGKLHIIQKADGPERIEEEWWIQDVRHRDYYVAEDTEGGRYWLFRSGHYIDGQPARWYLHGFF